VNLITRDIALPSLPVRPAIIHTAERQPALIYGAERQHALAYGTNFAEEIKAPAPEPVPAIIEEGVMSLERRREYLEMIGPCPKLPSEYLRFM